MRYSRLLVAVMFCAALPAHRSRIPILGLAAAWASTPGMAYYAIRKGMVEIHKEWMVRAYVVTFAFVTFRVFSDYGPTSHLKPANDLFITLAWACWVVPLSITELILQLKRTHKALLKRA